MAFVDGGYEGRIDGAGGCCVEILGEFAFVVIMVENAVGLVWIGEFDDC